MKEVICTKCKNECVVDGEYPEFDAWCYTCNNYAEGFDVLEYGADYIADKIDYYSMMKE